jgi:hypothetical protein
MKPLLLALLACGPLGAQTVAFYIDTSNGGLPASQLTPLPSTYQFPDTPAGTATSVVIRVVNTSSTDAVTLDAIFIGASPGSSVATPNFTITGWQTGGAKLAPQAFKLFTVNFTPANAGAAAGYLQAQVDENPAPMAVATLQGNGTASPLVLTCQDANASQCDGKTPLQPNSSVPITFGSPGVGITVGYGYQITFTFTNQSSAVTVTTPAVSLQNANPTSAFNLDTYPLPSKIVPNSTASFTVTFTPQANGSPNFQASLIVGSNAFPLMGIVANPAVEVKCTDKTGAGCQMSGNKIPLGPDPSTLTLTFQVINPNPLGTLFADISLQTPPSIVGSGFTMSTPGLGQSNATSAGSPVQAGQPITIHPGWTLTFQVTFNGTQPQSGTLTIPGIISYTLNAQPFPQLGSAQSDLPGITLMCGSSPCKGQTFTSQQQVHATLQLSKPSTGSATLALSFSPLVKGVTDDPAVTFISPFNTRKLGPINFSQSSVTGIFASGGSQFTFQTGTTAGTLTFTLTDSLTQETLTWNIDIPPAQVHISSGQAVRQGANLLITVTGYDNTYSIGQLSFAFSTTTTGTITVPVDATLNFHQYFFNNDQAGGAFALQASFPVVGDPSQIGSVAVTLNNSAGQTSTTQTFQ